MTPLDRAVVRGWARGRPAAIVLGPADWAHAIADLSPTTTIEVAEPRELAEPLTRIVGGTLIINAGKNRGAVMRVVRHHAPAPVTVLWHRYALRFGDHAIEEHLTPSRLIDRWAVFEVPAAPPST